MYFGHLLNLVSVEFQQKVTQQQCKKHMKHQCYHIKNNLNLS